MIDVVCVALTLFTVAVLLRFVLSWFPIAPGSFLESIHGVVVVATDWALQPLRRVLPPVQIGNVALDLTPMIIIFGGQIIQGIICR